MKKFLILVCILPFLQLQCFQVDLQVLSDACFFSEDSTTLYLFRDGIPLGNIPQLSVNDDYSLEGLHIPLFQVEETADVAFLFSVKEKNQDETVAEGKIITNNGDFTTEAIKGTFELVQNNECLVIKVGE